MSEIDLSSTELIRYQRQINLNTFGLRGQLCLKKAKVLIIGLGGLGQPCAQILSAAGVGELGLMDADCVEASNLHRQFLSTPKDVGRAKIEVVKCHLKRQNPDVKITLFQASLSAEQLIEPFRTYDLIIDGTDNFTARYAACDLALKLKKPLLHASILKENGMLALFEATGPCYRCLFPEPPPPDSIPSCSEAGVLPTTTSFFGSLLADQAIAWLLGEIGKLQTHFIQCNIRRLDISWFKKPKETHCPACFERGFDQLVYPKPQSSCMTLDQRSITINNAIASLEDYLWIDIRTTEERQHGHIPNSIHIPLKSLREELEKLPTQKPFLLYCQSGARSAKALKALAHIPSLYQLEKGYMSWLERKESLQKKIEKHH